MQDQLYDPMLTLGRVLNLYWLVVSVVQEMKKHFSSALTDLLELFHANTMMMQVLNVLVSMINNEAEGHQYTLSMYISQY